MDLIYFPSYNYQLGKEYPSFEFGGLTTGEIYEIEPITLHLDESEGVAQALRYVTLLTINKQSLFGFVFDATREYSGQPYDWRHVQWKIGNKLTNDPVSVKLQGERWLLAWKQAPGLILYIDTNNKDQVEQLLTQDAYIEARNSLRTNFPAVMEVIDTDTFWEKCNAIWEAYWDAHTNVCWSNCSDKLQLQSVLDSK